MAKPTHGWNRKIIGRQAGRFIQAWSHGMSVQTTASTDVGWVYDRRFLAHDPGAAHVERSEWTS